MEIVAVLLLGFLGGAVTLFGGLIYMFLDINKRLLQFITIATTGAIFSVVLLGALPVSLKLAGAGYTALSFMLGGLVFMITGTLFPHTYGAEKYEDRLYSLLRTGSLVISGMVLYNIPAGLLIGSGFAYSPSLGLSVLIAIVLENITRGVAVSPPLTGISTGKPRMMLIMLMAGIPAVAGSALAFTVLAGAIPVIIGSGLAFSAGAMFFICTDQLVAMMKTFNRPHDIAAAIFFGVVIGVLILGI
jgi:ZIP family zinc transporter